MPFKIKPKSQSSSESLAANPPVPVPPVIHLLAWTEVCDLKTAAALQKAANQAPFAGIVVLHALPVRSLDDALGVACDLIAEQVERGDPVDAGQTPDALAQRIYENRGDEVPLRIAAFPLEVAIAFGQLATEAAAA